MGMKKFKLEWSDGVEAVDPRITTENGKHSYTFEAANEDDAMAVARTFATISPEHSFVNHELNVVEEKSDDR